MFRAAYRPPEAKLCLGLVVRERSVNHAGDFVIIVIVEAHVAEHIVIVIDIDIILVVVEVHIILVFVFGLGRFVFNNNRLLGFQDWLGRPLVTAIDAGCRVVLARS